jgi:hypothetical protein
MTFFLTHCASLGCHLGHSPLFSYSESYWSSVFVQS